MGEDSLVLTSGQEAALKVGISTANARLGRAAVGVIRGYAGTGKALASDQPVQTPTGPRVISELKIGDFVLGADGKATKVLGVFPQGMRQAYLVTFRDGASVECDLEHLWAVWTHKRRQKNKAPEVCTLRSILDSGLRFRSGPYKYSVPLCSEVVYEKAVLPIAPYLFGALIGNGTSLGHTPTLCQPDIGIAVLRRAASELPKGMEVRINKAPTCPQYRFIDPTQRGNRLTSAFRLLGVTQKSPNRFIPAVYLTASSEQRWDLLRGLMDTDGSCCKNRTRFSTSSVQLASDVVSLVQSLGGTAIKSSRCRKGNLEWNVNIKTFKNPFFLARKREGWSFSKKNPPSRFIIKVTPTRKCAHVCIKVAATDGLFLTKDYIVTHNTTMLRVLAEEIGPPMFLTPTGKATLRLQEATGFEASTIHRWMYQPEVDKQSGVVRFDRKPLEKISRPSNHLIAVDEASMISEPIWTELLRVAALLKCNILLIGDPFQLPPVDPEARHPFCVLDDRFPADFKADLKEIVRQALDNPIIKASMYIRQGDMGAARALLPNLERMESWKLTLDICKKADGVVICHRNVTRHKINEGVRRDLKLPPAIQTGEPMLILKNCYEANVYNGEVLPFPGWTWESDKVEVTDRYRNLSATTRFGATSFNNTKVLLAHERIRGKMEDIGYGPVAYAASRTYYGKSTPEYPASRTNFRPFGKKKTSEPKHPFLDANFGYSLTCHKCQGSEFNRVLIIMEPTIRINEEEGLRWVYTAVTRAKEQAFLYWA